MLFNSLEFFIFFPVVTLIYFLLPHRLRWSWLLLASCYFYMRFIPIYILILFFTIGVDYLAGLVIEKARGPKRKLFLIFSIIANIGVLAVFKYFNFLNANLEGLAKALDWNYPIEPLAIILPIGLSFHTFQSLSYTIEVYFGRQKAERNLGIFALYVMFYPQLVAGPIERPQNLLHQFREKHSFEYKRVTDGLKLMAWGLFKKVVIADRLAVVVNHVYGHPRDLKGGLLIATVCFAYQIYCDFSGYSDIAIGAAQVMGFRLMTNFRRPYFAKSIAEFWKRWHISLSSWFRDYLYIPLGGNRVAIPRWYFNLFFTFLISGFWHGANWTFIIWGALHGAYLISSLMTERVRAKIVTLAALDQTPRLHRLTQIFITFALVCFAWIFFRANTVSDAYFISTHLLSFDASHLGQLGLSRADWVVVLLAIALMELVHLKQRHRSVREQLANKPIWVRWVAYYALMLACLIFGVFTASQFIYFQF